MIRKFTSDKFVLTLEESEGKYIVKLYYDNAPIMVDEYANKSSSFVAFSKIKYKIIKAVEKARKSGIDPIQSFLETPSN